MPLGTVDHFENQKEESLSASFDIVYNKSLTQFDKGDEYIYEAEVIKVCDQVASKFKEMGNFKIKISSTEIIDGILEESKV